MSRRHSWNYTAGCYSAENYGAGAALGFPGLPTATIEMPLKGLAIQYQINQSNVQLKPVYSPNELQVRIVPEVGLLG